MSQTQDAIHDPAAADLVSARALHDAGRYGEAETMYRQLAATSPADWAAVIGLADVLADTSRADEAVPLYQSVIDGKAADAVTADAWDGLAAVHQDRGNLDDAVKAGLASTRLRRNADEAYQLGRTLENLGRPEDAILAFGMAFEFNPAMAEASAKVGTYHLTRGNYEQAAVHYRAAAEANPSIAEIQCNLASILDHLDDRTSALKHARLAIELKPNLVEAQNVMGLIWKHRRRPADAVAAFRRAIEAKPDYADAHNNLAAVLEQNQQIEAATPHYERASVLNPANPLMHMNFASNLLLRGEFPRGWAEMNWRRLDRSNPASRPLPKLMWDGVPLGGRTILLTAEQGIGDMIQFIRYAPIVAARSARVVVEVPPSLLELARNVPGVADAVPMQLTPADPLPPFDTHCPMMSLPMVLGTDQTNIPANVPYIKAPADRAAVWKDRVGNLPGKKVGLVWAGNPKFKQNQVRSVPGEKLAGLAGISGVSWVSLQKNRVTEPAADLKLVDYTADLNDFADTAALIENLDLVLTVDTSVAHLAGAMGKPVWIMLQAVPDWRWLLGRADSPWYPSARLFRQTTPGDWGGVFQRVTAAL